MLEIKGPSLGLGQRLGFYLHVHQYPLSTGTSNDELTDVLEQAAINHPEIVVKLPSAPLRRRTCFGSARPVDSIPDVAEGFRAMLQMQVDLLPWPPVALTVAAYLIDAVDDQGVLTSSLAEIREVLGKEEKIEASEAQIDRVRLALQRELEPAGMVALSARDAVLVRLAADETLGTKQARSDLTLLANASWNDVVKGRVARLQRALDNDFARVEAALRLLLRLKWRGESTNKPGDSYVRPEVRIRQPAEGASATVEAEPIGDAYPTVRGSKSAMEHIDWRKENVCRITNEIFWHQTEFLRLGTVGLRALTQAHVAKKVDLDDSTVSRLVNGRYVETPLGVFELAEFFDRGIDGVHREAIKARLAELVKAEPPQAALSDGELALQLARRFQIELSRRTACKYRDELGIVDAPARMLLHRERANRPPLSGRTARGR